MPRQNHAMMLNDLCAALSVDPNVIVNIVCHHADDLGATVVRLDSTASFRFVGGCLSVERAVSGLEWQTSPSLDSARVRADTLLDHLSNFGGASNV